MALTRRELLAGKENEVASFPLGYHLPFHYLGVAAQIEAAKRFLGRSGGNMVVIDIKDESGNMCLEVDHPLAPKAYPSTYGAGLQEPCSGGCKPATKYPYKIVYWTTYRALERLAVVNPGAIVRPWIQAYTPLVKNADVVKQINAANDAGGMGAMCWNDYDIYPRLYP